MLDNWQDIVKEDLKGFKGKWSYNNTGLTFRAQWVNEEHSVRSVEFIVRSQKPKWYTPFVKTENVSIYMKYNGVIIDGELSIETRTVAIADVIANTWKGESEMNSLTMFNKYLSGVDIQFKPKYDNLYRIMCSNYRSHQMDGDATLANGTKVTLAEAQAWEQGDGKNIRKVGE